MLYSDATLTQGAWVDDDRGICIMDNGQNNEHIDLHCDHRGVCLMLNDHAARHPLRYQRVSDLLTKLLAWMESKHISLSVQWIPSEYNPADAPSRSALMENPSALSTDNIIAKYSAAELSELLLWISKDSIWDTIPGTDLQVLRQ
jgi:hypothetical protein